MGRFKNAADAQMFREMRTLFALSKTASRVRVPWANLPNEKVDTLIGVARFFVQGRIKFSRRQWRHT